MRHKLLSVFELRHEKISMRTFFGLSHLGTEKLRRGTLGSGVLILLSGGLAERICRLAALSGG